MKPLKRNHLIAVAVAIIAGAATSATAQNTNAFVSVDEFGNGTFNASSLSSAPAGSLGLQYSLPFVVVPGSVEIFDPVATNQLSDVILFTNTSLFFESDSKNGAHSPADVPSFTFTAGGLASITEQVSAGSTFAIYSPGPGMPGYSSLNPSYYFTSDVPEPSCCLLTSLGWTILLLHRGSQARK